ncbi:hypothetical protein [Mycoplasma phocoenae]|uniref:MFS transporter n=1 Tax=Mycoplasma phocoenae TaxID=754517 RepID=A0A858U245_9MOLU|nr:hypothetical protein [Mycoplasma phocoenae]QJG67214.1 MFS transporter [Mycoplasma phocoenae]
MKFKKNKSTDIETEKPKKTKNINIFKFLKNRKLIFSNVLVFSIIFLVFSYLNLLVGTTVHSYTIGAFLGISSIFFYLLLIIYSLSQIFSFKLKFKYKIFHFNFIRLMILFIVLSLFMGVIEIVCTNESIKTVGNHFSLVFNNWFNQYTNVKSAALPYAYTAGILPTLYYASFASAGTDILAIILSIVLLIISVLTFFVSDSKFKLFSFSRARRIKAREEITKKQKRSVRKYKPLYNVNKSENTTKTSNNFDYDNHQKINEEIEVTDLQSLDSVFDTTEFETTALIQNNDSKSIEEHKQEADDIDNSVFNYDETNSNVHVVEELNDEWMDKLEPLTESFDDVLPEKNAKPETKELIETGNTLELAPEEEFKYDDNIESQEDFFVPQDSVQQDKNSKKQERFSIIEDSSDMGFK